MKAQTSQIVLMALVLHGLAFQAHAEDERHEQTNSTNWAFVGASGAVGTASGILSLRSYAASYELMDKEGRVLLENKNLGKVDPRGLLGTTSQIRRHAVVDYTIVSSNENRIATIQTEMRKALAKEADFRLQAVRDAQNRQLSASERADRQRDSLLQAEIESQNAKELEAQAKDLMSESPHKRAITLRKLLVWDMKTNPNMGVVTQNFVEEQISKGYRIKAIREISSYTMVRARNLTWLSHGASLGAVVGIGGAVAVPTMNAFTADQVQNTDYKPAIRAEGTR